MGKIVKVSLTKNKANGQINLAIPKTKISKKLFNGLSISKKVKISIGELYDS